MEELSYAALLHPLAVVRLMHRWTSLVSLVASACCSHTALLDRGD